MYVRNVALADEWIVSGSKAKLGIHVARGDDGFFYVGGWWWWSGSMSRPKQRFPATETGWQDAWRAFEAADPEAAADHVRSGARAQRSIQVSNARRDALAALGSLPTLCVISDCALIGGFGHGSATMQASHVLYFTHDALLIVDSGQLETVARMEYREMLALRVDGPGAVRRGGGFVGGGFGLEGAAEGMIVASLLNALTQVTTVQTLVEVQDRDSDFIFFTSTTTPEQLRTTLMPVQAKLRAVNVDVSPDSAPSSADATDRLERLARLFQQGLLTAAEFQSAKANILGP